MVRNLNKIESKIYKKISYIVEQSKVLVLECVKLLFNWIV